MEGHGLQRLWARNVMMMMETPILYEAYQTIVLQIENVLTEWLPERTCWFLGGFVLLQLAPRLKDVKMQCFRKIHLNISFILNFRRSDAYVY